MVDAYEMRFKFKNALLTTPRSTYQFVDLVPFIIIDYCTESKYFQDERQFKISVKCF